MISIYKAMKVIKKNTNYTRKSKNQNKKTFTNVDKIYNVGSVIIPGVKFASLSYRRITLFIFMIINALLSSLAITTS